MIGFQFFARSLLKIATEFMSHPVVIANFIKTVLSAFAPVKKEKQLPIV